MPISITLIGGPTALIEIDGFRLLTDPTFDAPGAYQLPHVKLEKTIGPALTADAIGPVEAVLLSHDQHSDNLDNSGREFLKHAKRVLTTEAGAGRLGGQVEGLAPWGTAHLRDRDGNSLTITATPARHGPAGIEPLSGDVIGLVLPFAGAAQTRGPFHLTMDTNDTIETARAFPDAVIVPIHTEGWAHFRQNGEDLRKTFDVLGFGPRLRLLEPGVPTVVEAP